MSNVLQNAWRLMLFTPIREVLGMASRRRGWRQMIADAELPEPVQEKIEQVTVKSKLWNRERADIAEELIAHFEDGLEAGASAEELAESFGDTRTAAQLIRNAKRRCRPVWWQAWWWMSRSFLMFVPCYILLAAWLSTARPVVSVDYQAIINKAAHAVPEEERAWPVYMEALGYVVKEGKPVVYSLGVDSDDDGGRLPLDYERDPVSDYLVRPPNVETDVDGDWVIWSLVAPVEKNDDEEL